MGFSTRRTVAAVVALCGTVGLAGLPVVAQAAAGEPSITEIHYDNAGTDAGEAIEVTAAPGTDLTGWSVVLYNGTVPTSGVVYSTKALPAANAQGVSVVTYPVDGIQNGGNDGVALVRPDGSVAEFISYEGVLTASAGPAAGRTSTDIGVSESSTTPVGASLQKVDGAWKVATTSSFGVPNGGTTPTPVPTTPVPTTPVPTTPAPTPTNICDVAPTATIPQVQGAGSSTPLAGQTVTVRGVVVGDAQKGGFGGFYLQDPKGDGNPATSDGVFVYDPDGTPDVKIGDVVALTGKPVEFKGLTQIAQLTDAAVCGKATLPNPAPLDLPATPAQLEALEGMYVTPVDKLTVSEVYNLNRFGEITLSEGGRLLNPTEIAEPGAEAQAVMAANQARRIILDDGLTTNLSTAKAAPPYLTVNDPVRVGDTVATLQPSVLTYGFDAFRLEPADGTAEGTTFAATNPRPAAPKNVGGDIKVADANVLNYFVTFGPQSRGAKTPAELAQQQAKIVAELRGLKADVIGLQEIENSAITTPDDPYKAVRTLTDALNAAEGAKVWSYVQAHESSDVISNAIIYRTDRVEPVGAPMKPAEDAAWDNAREPIAQTFTANGDAITVIVNHFKSKGSGEGAGNTDSGDGQGKSNADRVAQATSLVAFVGTVKAQAKDADVLLVGDFNAYTKEDPLDVLRAAGLVDLGAIHAKGDHSYVFNGESGSLDHAFATKELAAKVTGMDIWNINAEESYGYQYDAPYEGIYAPYAYRASDHNPAVIGVNLTEMCGGKMPTIMGTPGNDILTGTNAADVIMGSWGNDTITGLNGDDIVCGGLGNDTVRGGNGNDRLYGDAGTDSLFGENGDDILVGGLGTDRLDGGKGKNTLTQ